VPLHWHTLAHSHTHTHTPIPTPTVPFGAENDSEVRVCDLRTREWSVLDVQGCDSGSEAGPDGTHTRKRPSGRFGQSMVVGPDGCLYMYAGTNGTVFFNEVFRFNIAKREWCNIAYTGVPPKPRHDARMHAFPPTSIRMHARTCTYILTSILTYMHAHTHTQGIGTRRL
jgi:hypothetical protein